MLTGKQKELKSTLIHGDRAEISKEFLISRTELAQVLNGKREDDRVWGWIEEVAAARSKKPTLASAGMKKELQQLKNENTILVKQNDFLEGKLKDLNEEIESTLHKLKEQEDKYDAEISVLEGKLSRNSGLLSVDLVEPLIEIYSSSVRKKLFDELKKIVLTEV